MNRLTHITLAQLDPTVGDLTGNAAKMVRWLKDLRGMETLVVFPELFLTGYPLEDLVLNADFLKAVQRQIDALLSETQDCPPFLLPAPIVEQGRIYNAAHLCHQGKIIQTVRKVLLPDYGVFDESRVFEQGPQPLCIEIGERRLGLMICEDMWNPYVAQHLKADGAQHLIVINGSPFDETKREERLKQAKARVAETRLPLTYLNMVGGQDELVFDGQSFILDGNGALRHLSPAFEQNVVTIGLDNFSGTSLAPGMRREEILFHAIVTGTRDYFRKNGASKAVLGLSGGIDSALAAIVAVEALGKENVHVLMLPSRFSSEGSLSDARTIAKALEITHEEISITPLMETMEATRPDLSGLAHENMQARLRGILLMSHSNQHGAMVLTTGNKSEIAVGYSTLYGDMCGSFNPLKDLYKKDIYNLCEWYNTKRVVVPKAVFDKAPSAELRPDQRDEDSLMPYPLLDKILYGLIEEDKGVETLIEEGMDADSVKKVARLLKAAEYKRRQSAPGPKVSRRAFGRDRRYPMTNRFSS
ncbi:MAG: NAD+ synthase [Pseudobdellovibrionaceae bacterium]